MKICQIYFYLILLLPIFISSHGHAQNSKCDSSKAIFNRPDSEKIALDSEGDYYFVEKSEWVIADSICCWKITIASGYSVCHHGYYSRDYSIIWIDSKTGTIVKEERHKRLEGPCDGRD